jgi:hypothetical protein
MQTDRNVVVLKEMTVESLNRSSADTEHEAFEQRFHRVYEAAFLDEYNRSEDRVKAERAADDAVAPLLAAERAKVELASEAAERKAQSPPSPPLAPSEGGVDLNPTLLLCPRCNIARRLRLTDSEYFCVECGALCGTKTSRGPASSSASPEQSAAIAGAGGETEEPTSEAFFASLFDGCTGSVQLVSIKPDVKGVQGYVTMPQPCDWSAVLAWGRQESTKKDNAYFACATQPPGSTVMRSAATAYEVAFLGADLDGLADPVKKAAATEQLKTSGRVTHLVDSGAGLHVYAKLPEPVRVTDENRDTLTDAQYAFGAGLHELVHGTKPAKVDRHDLASVLRIPGTTNYPDQKKRDAGRVVAPTMVLWQSGTAIALRAFDDWRERYPRPSGSGAERLSYTKADIRLPANWDTWLAKDDALHARFEQTASGPNQRDLSPSGYHMSLCNHLATHYGDRITDGEAIAVGLEFYDRVGKDKPIKSIATSWANAKASCGFTVRLPDGAEDAGPGASDDAQTRVPGLSWAWGWERFIPPPWSIDNRRLYTTVICNPARQLHIASEIDSGRAEVLKSIDEKNCLVCRQVGPLLWITGIVERDDGERDLRVEWAGGSATISARAMSDPRQLVELASHGFPIVDYNLRHYSRWLYAFYRANKRRFPVERQTHRLGWHGERFVWPDTVMGPPGLDAPRITFVARDGEAARIAAALTTRHGTLDGWRAAVGPVYARYPIVAATVCAALGSLLLTPLGLTEGPTVDLNEECGSGKTVTLYLAATAFGEAGEGDDRLVTSFRSTMTGLERRAGTLGSLPLFLDETRECRRREDLAATIYMLANGHGPDRGTPTGAAYTERWRLVTIATGEASLVDYVARAGGAVGRILPLSGLPFGEKSPERAREVMATIAAASANAGHAARELVRRLIAGGFGTFEELRARYDHRLADRLTKPGHTRLAKHIALVELMAELLAEAFRLTAPDFGPLWDEATRQGGTPGDERAALAALVSVVAENRHRVVGLGVAEGGHKWGEEAGVYRDKKLAVHTDWTKRTLEVRGFDYHAAIRAWNRTGKLESDGKNIGPKVQCGPGFLGHWPRMLRFTVETTRDDFGIDGPALTCGLEPLGAGAAGAT